MVRIFSIIFFLLVSIGCTKNDAVTQANNSPAKKRYLALGDSYTIGKGVEPTERYSYFTVLSLRNLGADIQDPEYIATPGWTTANLLGAISDQDLQPNYDAVSILIGVNDQHLHVDTNNYKTEFAKVLERAIVLAKGKASSVYVLSIPDYSTTPFVLEIDKHEVAEQLSSFNRINKSITLQHGVSYIDITQLSREVLNDPSLLCPDSLHYSAKEYQKWADLMSPVMKERL